MKGTGGLCRTPCVNKNDLDLVGRRLPNCYAECTEGLKAPWCMAELFSGSPWNFRQHGFRRVAVHLP
eukprot:jgi/Botrbrau1/9738/Bobra.0388s0027.1